MEVRGPVLGDEISEREALLICPPAWIYEICARKFGIPSLAFGFEFTVDDEAIGPVSLTLSERPANVPALVQSEESLNPKECRFGGGGLSDD